MSQKPNKSYTRFQVGVLIVCIVYFGICIAAPKVRENRKEAERARMEAARDREVQRQHEQLMKEIEARRIQATAGYDEGFDYCRDWFPVDETYLQGKPTPKDAEYLMGFPIGASFPSLLIQISQQHFHIIQN